jgi:LPS sulfotransferase NodH
MPCARRSFAAAKRRGDPAQHLSELPPYLCSTKQQDFGPQMSTRRIACVLGNPRSGTTALRSALHNTGLFVDYGEIFHTVRSLTRKPFLNFLEAWPRPISGMIFSKDGTALSKAYLDDLQAPHTDSVPLIDVKHNSWGFLRPAWRYPHEEPLFLSILKARNSNLIFLRRRSLTDQIISYYLATRTDKWHSSASRTDIPPDIEAIPFDLQFAKDQASLFCRAECLMMSFIDSYPNKIVLNYDDLFADNAVSSGALQAISGLVGFEVPTAQPSLERNTIEKRGVIVNYDDVHAVVEAIRQAFEEGFWNVRDQISFQNF